LLLIKGIVLGSIVNALVEKPALKRLSSWFRFVAGSSLVNPSRVEAAYAIAAPDLAH
jgi:hypothetical protein